MNKKAHMTVWEELIKAIPTLIVLLLLVWAGVKLWDATHPDQYSQEKKDLLRLVAEIKDLDYSPGAKDEVTVPVFSRDYTIDAAVTVTKNQKDAYPGCNMDYCLCFVEEDDNENKICETFNLREEFGLKKGDCEDYKRISFDDSSVTTDLPVVLKRDDKCKVTISN